MSNVPDLEVLVERVNDLMPLPSAAALVMRAVEDPNLGMADVGRVVALDQALTARLLRLANSPRFGSQAVLTLDRAMVRLGMKTVRNEVMALCTRVLIEPPLEGYALDKGMLWRHSILCAVGSRMLAERRFRELADEAFVAGVLHDVGKAVMSEYVGEQYAEITSLVAAGGISFVEAERRILGFGHPEVGGAVACKWRFPQALVEAIAYHHAPSRAAEHQILASLVSLSDAVCLMLGQGLGGDGLMYKVEDEVIQRIGVTSSEIETLMSDIVDASRDYIDILEST